LWLLEACRTLQRLVVASSGALGRGDEADEDAIDGWLKAEFDAVVVVFRVALKVSLVGERRMLLSMAARGCR
jgi:hypothetical protein